MAGEAFERIKLAVRERLGCAVPPEAADEFELLLDGRQSVLVSFDAEAGNVTVTAPLALPAGGPSKAAMRYLLSRNLPAAGMAGSMLCASPFGGDALELVNVLPVAALEPAEIAGIAVNQAAEALRLSDYVHAENGRG